MSASDEAESLRALGALQDPSRRALYELIRVADAPVTREDAAAAVGLSRKLAAFHLEKLIEVGLLVAEFERGARPPALGRPPKTYRASGRSVSVSVPERRLEDLGTMLLDAVATARPDETPTDAALRVGYETGEQIGAALRSKGKLGRIGAERALNLVDVALRERGYEPERPSSKCLRLRNCPFVPLAQQATQVVCALNQRFVAGILDGLQATALEAVLAPSATRCCVEVRA